MRKILVVIDMQNDFINGALGTSEAEAIVDKVVNKIYFYPEEDVYGTMDTHFENYLDTQEGKKLPIPHCIFGTEGYNLHHKVRELINPMNFFSKSIFGSIDLGMELFHIVNSSSYKEEFIIEIVGLCTDICVISNALLFRTLMPDVKIVVDSSCCAGTTPEKHKEALSIMESCQIDII